MKSLLQEIYDFGERFVVFPDEHTHIAWATLVAYAPLYKCFRTTPRGWITAATKGCGKTTLADITELLIPNAKSLVCPSPSSLFRLIDKYQPTLIIDEIQELFGKKDISDITTIISSGFDQGKKVPRVEQVGKEWVVKEYNVFSPMWLVGIDKRNFPDAVLDRCITIRLKKKITSEPVEPFDLYTTPQEAKPIRDRLEAWSNDAAGKLKERGRPDVPEGIEARFRNKWEPLIAIADEADRTGDTPGTSDTGELWGSRIRRAALEYLKDEDSEETLDQGQLLLSHIRQVLNDTATMDDKISSADLVNELQRIEDAPWSRYRGSYPLSQNDLSILLRPYDIHPKARSFGDRRLRGYRTGDFEDAFKRYLPPIPAVSGVPAVSTVSPSNAPPRWAVTPVAGVSGLHTIRF